jgi:adenylate cyclase
VVAVRGATVLCVFIAAPYCAATVESPPDTRRGIESGSQLAAIRPAHTRHIVNDEPEVARIAADELARRVGLQTEGVLRLADLGVIERGDDGRFDPGDVHRVRLLNAFEDAGVPLDALIAASQAGTISLRYYDQLHPPPTALSGRTYGEYAQSLGERQSLLTRAFAAFGLAEPGADGQLAAEDEALLSELLDIVISTGQPDLALRAIRLFGEGARRAADGALGVYGEAVGGSSELLSGLPIDAVFERSLLPWARFAREATALAAWLISHHMSRAIDEYSVVSTERILEEGGFVPVRRGPPPAVAFVDLSGFTRLTEERGDEEAAAIALRLGDVATDAVRQHNGRVVKLLGDGVLIWFPDTVSALEATLDLLDALPAADLPTGHAGIAAGSLIIRDNDVFGRTVNLAARVADVAPDGHVYLPAASAASIRASGGWTVETVDATELQGIGRVGLVDVRRRASARPNGASGA